MLQKKGIAQNVILSIAVQLISLLLNFILSFLVPKFVDEYQYAYWQTYVLYVGYAGVLHFGLLDGIVLRYSQYNYDELDKERIRSQFKILFLSTGGIAVLGIILSVVFLSGVTQTIAVFVSVGIITKNIIGYNSYSFQITNRIDKYAAFTIAQRVSYGLITVVFLSLGVNRFEFYCLAALSSDIIGIILARFFNKGLYFGKSLPSHEAYIEWKKNVSSGIILMLSNWSAMLLVDFAKMIVQWHWDELTFGKVSFSFSLSNLFLTFITAISIVLFPQLKRTEPNKLPKIYKIIRDVISPLLFVAMLAYYPGCYIMEKILPKYSQSLIYLGLLLPIIIYTSKVSLLTNNYLKAYRKEKDMMRVNVISLAFAIVSFGVSTYIFNNLNALFVCVVLSNMIKSVLSERIVSDEIRISFTKEHIIEAIMTVAFILYTNYLSRELACAAYILTLMVYIWYFRKNIFPMINSIFGRLKNK